MLCRMGDPAYDPASVIGTKVGDYQVESLVAVGGMGSVYRALGDDGQPAAVKLVRTEYARDSVFRARFAREGKIAQQVKDPYVVPVFAVGEHEGVPYLVQRFVEGGTLGDRLEREKRLDVDVAVTLVGQVAQGLDALYAAGMVHRDVKPGNVLLDPDGTAYITDFGLAKDLDGTNLTRPGQALGSLDYISPEQIRSEPLTAATDVYSLGCVMFECFIGAPPFSRFPGMRVIMAQLTAEPPDPCAERPELSPELGEAILSAIEKDPVDRPQSAGEYARRLADAASS